MKSHPLRATEVTVLRIGKNNHQQNIIIIINCASNHWLDNILKRPEFSGKFS